MEWCRFVLQELAEVKDDSDDTEPVYFKACEKQFRIIYSKLEKWEYDAQFEFLNDIVNMYTTSGKELSQQQRYAFQKRFEGLWRIRSSWRPKEAL